MSDEQRRPGVAVDLDRLEQQAKDLYLHRFVENIRSARRAHGRFLILRAGDEVAIKSAADGSEALLEEITVDVEDESRS